MYVHHNIITQYQIKVIYYYIYIKLHSKWKTNKMFFLTIDSNIVVCSNSLHHIGSFRYQ